MVKISKAMRKRGMITFYISEEFRPVFDMFLELIADDEDIEKENNEGNQGKISLAIKMFIADYVTRKTSVGETN